MVEGELFLQPYQSIVKYIESSILPRYKEFDGAHNETHVKKVINNSLQFAGDYSVDVNMVYVIAAFHDLGLKYGRENHEIRSGEILLSDKQLELWFTREKISIMKEAVEDHRASGLHEPRTIYGKIVSEADREIEYDMVLKRIIQYNLKHFPNYTKAQNFECGYNHLTKKYGENGYIKLWLKSSKNVENLKDIRLKMKDKENVLKDFEAIYTSLKV